MLVYTYTIDFKIAIIHSVNRNLMIAKCNAMHNVVTTINSYTKKVNRTVVQWLLSELVRVQNNTGRRGEWVGLCGRGPHKEEKGTESICV